MALLDASIPTQATLGWDLARLHRDTRAAVNTLSAAVIAGTLPGMRNEAMGAPPVQTIDVLGIIAINVIMDAAPNNLVNLPNGFDGQFIILRVDETEGGVLTVVHNVAAINLQGNLPFPMIAGDVLILLNKGGILGGYGGVWFEIHRQLYNAGILPGMTNLALGAAANTIDVLGSIAINITLDGAPNDLDNLLNGFDGQFIILRIDEGEAPGVDLLNVIDNAAFINLQENLDVAMRAGDVMILLNKGGILGGVSGAWFEIHRQLYDAVLGLTDLNGIRYRLFVDVFGALNVVPL